MRSVHEEFMVIASFRLFHISKGSCWLLSTGAWVERWVVHVHFVAYDMARGQGFL